VSDIVVEISEFRLNAGADEEAFLEASQEMMNALKKQGGIVNRELLKAEDGLWIDLVHWENMDTAKSVANNVMKIPSCLEFLDMIDQASIKSRYYTQIESYR